MEIENAYKPGETVTVTNLLDYIFYSTIFREKDGTVEKDVNVLVANFVEVNSYNFQYFVKPADDTGSSGKGSISNRADSFTSTDREKGSKADNSALVNGSTALDNLDKNSVFVRWEYTNENGEVHTFDKPQLTLDEILNLVGKNLDQLDPYPKIYTFYAVFEIKNKVQVRYVSADPINGGYVTLGEETVYQTKTPNGSTAVPYSGMEVDYWSLDEDGESLSTNAKFIPVIEEKYFTDSTQILTYYAHFKSQTDSKIMAQW